MSGRVYRNSHLRTASYVTPKSRRVRRRTERVQNLVGSHDHCHAPAQQICSTSMGDKLNEWRSDRRRAVAAQSWQVFQPAAPENT